MEDKQAKDILYDFYDNVNISHATFWLHNNLCEFSAQEHIFRFGMTN